MIVLHYTGMPDVEGAITQLCTAGTDVSAHYIVLEDGRIVQCVPRKTSGAWHARRGLLGPARKTSIPARSASKSSIAATTGAIRIFRCGQIAAVIALCRGIMLRRQDSIAPACSAQFGRSSSAQEGPRARKFPWHSLANSGVGHWVQPAADRARRDLEARHHRRGGCRLAGSPRPPYGYGIPTSGKIRTARPWKWSPPSSATSAPPGVDGQSPIIRR